MPGFTQIPNDHIFDDPLWTSEPMTKGQAYADLFRLAQFKPGLVNKRGNLIELEPGQIGWSMVELSKRWNRSLGWVRRLLNYLENAQHIEQQKTNVSTTITLLHWGNYGIAERTADGSQKEQQTDSRQYPNNIVNTEKIENIEHTQDDSVRVDIEIIWKAWNSGKDEILYDNDKRIINNALNDKAVEYWLEKLGERKKVKDSGGYAPDNMKYWFNGGYRDMVIPKQSVKKEFKQCNSGLYRAYCSKCGTDLFPKENELRFSTDCCGVEMVPDKPIKKVNNGVRNGETKIEDLLNTWK